MDYSKISKVISHALRHEPWLYELEPDENGWVPVEQLLVSLRTENAAWKDLGTEDLQRMIDLSEKKRHEIAGEKIRAIYGHSLPGKVKHAPAAPPEILYHGTSPSVKILAGKEGLLPMSRQYVHLSVTPEMAVEVAKRKTSTPVVLQIAAQQATNAGVAFYKVNDKVWLADNIPPAFIGATV